MSVFIKFEQVAVSNAVKDVDDLTIPANATHVQLQAEPDNNGTGIRYTLDGTTVPTVNSGMLLPATSEIIEITIDALRRIKFIRDKTVDETLHLHYFAGRDI